ncbi:molybdopterin cofactor-binding domain-containing protein [Streptomyces noursei]|uniref:molybdopterin cofactor-binding domain-containing protein n=1 Tax=Streptomyces noursei TaxID=1971 RepID=UPI0023DA95AC|nr:molybdopterin cofactor-binding domain-containing protein [Streptomyces noursei]
MKKRRLLEGFDDYSTAKVRMEVIAGEPVATVHTAMAEVGQGGVTVHAQIARTELGVHQVTIHPADTQVGSAGSTSASRQTYVTGGAVKNACELVREKVLEIGRRKMGTYHPAWATAELLLEAARSSPTAARSSRTSSTCWRTRWSSWRRSGATGPPRRST